MKKLNKGWVEGSVQDLLNLDDADMEYIETKRALSNYLRTERQKKHLTQISLASLLKTSQSRIAKMENGDPSVTLDLLVYALYRLGTTRKKLAKAI